MRCWGHLPERRTAGRSGCSAALPEPPSGRTINLEDHSVAMRVESRRSYGCQRGMLLDRGALGLASDRKLITSYAADADVSVIAVVPGSNRIIVGDHSGGIAVYAVEDVQK